jgi:hypothetical protein
VLLTFENLSQTQSLRTDDGDGDGDEEYQSSLDMGGLESETLPKIDEATGVRPPSRRGRPPSRANQTLLRSHLGRPLMGTEMGGAAEETSPISGDEAGRELFSDCTTPDAPEECDAMVRLCVCVCVCMHTHTLARAHTHNCMHTYMYIHPCRRPYAPCTYMHVCMYVHTHTHTHTHTRTHTHLPTYAYIQPSLSPGRYAGLYIHIYILYMCVCIYTYI